MAEASRGMPRTENSTHDFDSRLFLHVERHAAGQSLDRIDIHTLRRYFSGHVCYLTRGQTTAENRDYPAVFTLHPDPLLIFTDADRRKTNGHIKFRGLKQQLLHYITRH